MGYPVNRRGFLAAGAAAIAAGGESPAVRPASSYHEAARDVPVVDSSDVVVCGAGPAGFAAAIAAARAGAKTRLIEVNGCLGGVWTAGLLSWILDADNKAGLMAEIVARLAERKASAPYSGAVGYDIEPMKLLLEEMCLDAGVAIQLHTRVVAAKVNSGRLELVVTESKSGREAYAGKVFVDASGDGDLAWHAGCKFDYGRPGDGQAQPMSFIAMLAGLEIEQVTPFTREWAEPAGLGSPKQNLLKEMRRAGCDPSYAQPTLFYIRPGLFCLMANHEYGVAGTNAADVTAASLRGRAEVHRLVGALKALGGPWKNAAIVATPEQIGVREGRRVHGLYQVTADDMIEGRKQADAVCEVRFPVDVHSTDPKHSKGIPGQGVRAKPYDIPYRALVAKDVTGLLLAGRLISGDFLAHASYRVTGDAVAMGEAAGLGAALAAKRGQLPQDVPWAEIARPLAQWREKFPAGGKTG